MALQPVPQVFFRISILDAIRVRHPRIEVMLINFIPVPADDRCGQCYQEVPGAARLQELMVVLDRSCIEKTITEYEQSEIHPKDKGFSREKRPTDRK